GQTWGGDANSRSAFSVSGGAGRVTTTGRTSYSAVLGPATANTEVYALPSINSFTNRYFGNVLRWSDGNNWYKAFTDGANLFIQRSEERRAGKEARSPFATTGGR